MDAPTIIARLRDRRPLSADELGWFARGLANGDVTDAQAGAFAMAALLNGMADAERVALTLAMRDSGDVLAWDLPGPAIDKHSTGGIGDCVSLLLAPMLAVCGAYVPMISGRGLGHTGGTLDKLEAIPGLRTDLDETRFRKVVGDVGCAIVAASGDIAPADKRLYAIRDVTGTVESIDLITASILSKKLAAGLDALVLDVKCGSGAFMTDKAAARALAGSLVATANGAGCRTSALLTAMDQPCVPSLGNALEVAEVMRVLEGSSVGVLAELSVKLCGEVLALAGLVKTARAGEKLAAGTLEDGRAAERFEYMVSAQGASPDFLQLWRAQLPEAPVIREVPALADGVVTAMDGRALGMCVVRLGGGRLRGTDQVDPAVGLAQVVALGDRVGSGQPLAMVHAAREDAAEAAVAAVQAAIEIGPAATGPLPLILERVGP